MGDRQDLPAWFQRIGYVPQTCFIADSGAGGGCFRANLLEIDERGCVNAWLSLSLPGCAWRTG